MFSIVFVCLFVRFVGGGKDLIELLSSKFIHLQFAVNVTVM